MSIWLISSVLKKCQPQVYNDRSHRESTDIYIRIKSLSDTDPDIIHWVNWEQPDSWFCRLQAHHIVLFINAVF